MKTYNNLFEKICSFKNLHNAFLKARKCKKYRDYVLKFSFNLENNLLKLREELLTQTYLHGNYREFIVYDAKKRHIKAAPFRDRVVHHALCNIIDPIFNKSFVYDSYACRKDKGTHKALKRLRKYLKNSIMYFTFKNLSYLKIFCFQADISKYFNSIDHKVLLCLINKKITDKKVIWLIKNIIDSSYSKKIYQNLFNVKKIGIPIGNLTSQLFANIYLNELDQFVKHQIKIKYYIRYMDDFLVLHYSKKHLHKVKQKIKIFLKQKLELNLHPKKVNIFPIKNGIYFLGYINFKNYRLLNKHTVKRFLRKMKIYQKKLREELITQKKLMILFNHGYHMLALEIHINYCLYANINCSQDVKKNYERFIKAKN